MSLRDVVETARALWRSEIWRMVNARGLRVAVPGILRRGIDPAGIFAVHGAAIGERPAIIEEERVTTYAELDRRARRLANYLSAHGVSPGARVALVLRNSAAFVETEAACAKLKVGSVPLSYRLTAPELAYVFRDASPAAVVFHADLREAVMGADPEGAGVRVRLSVGGVVAGCVPFEEAVAAGADAEPPAAEQSPEIVIYTSGTTGRPKGAVRSFKGSAFKQFVGLLRMVPLKHGDVHLVAGPLYHSLAGGFTLVNIGLGATLLVMPRFRPEEFLALVERWKVTTSAVVPTMVRELVELPEEVRRRHDLSSLRAVVVGGAALEYPLVKRFAEVYRPDVLYNLYGATEVGWVTIAGPRDLLDRPGTIGRAIPGCEVVLLDETRREVPPGEVGELFVKSDLLIEGYHRNAEATRSSRHGDHFTVGDLARRDADGFFFLVGRKLDLVISGGVNIYPAEVEQALLLHPGVRDAAVIGVPDERWGEALRAFVVAADGARLDAEEIARFLRERLAGYKVPKQWRFVPDLPRNPTGKVLKRELREWA